MCMVIKSRQLLIIEFCLVCSSPRVASLFAMSIHACVLLLISCYTSFFKFYCGRNLRSVFLTSVSGICSGYISNMCEGLHFVVVFFPVS